MKKFLENNILVILVIIISLFLRLSGINWDQNQHLHPDERFLTMVTQAIQIPQSIFDYLSNPQNTKMIPYNIGYNFFVYGTLPMYLVKITSPFIIFDKFDYNNVTLVGRLLSAIFDIGTVFLVYKITTHIFNKKTANLASFIYAISVLPIQLSHFFTVDTFLVFFITSSFYFLIPFLKKIKPVRNSIFAGALFGLALASKISALLFLPIILLAAFIFLIKYKNFKNTAFCLLLITLFSYLTLHLTDPHIFTSGNIFDFSINPLFASNLSDLSSYSKPGSLFPPAIQWIGTTPFIFPLKNIILWGLGLPLGIITVLGVLYSILFVISKLLLRVKKSGLNLSQLSIKRLIQFLKGVPIKWYSLLLVLIWVLFLFFYQSIQEVKAMRYFYPIYPFLAIITGYFLSLCSDTLIQKIKNKSLRIFIFSVSLLILLVWPFSFIAIYSRPHSRVSASDWIYKNIPSGSTISCEYWDDCLPLPLGNKYPTNSYKIVSLEMFQPDTKSKWENINKQLEEIDYLILSSNRVWGSVDNAPQRYYKTVGFYENLFAGKAGFKKIAEFSSFPALEIGDLKLEIKDETAEEAFTVYDHPKVLIFKNKLFN